MAKSPRIIATAALLALSACGIQPDALPPSHRALIVGRVVERMDAPPYSFLRLQEKPGTDVWVAVPIASYPSDSLVRLKDCVLVKDRLVKATWRRLDEVYFGTLVGR